MSQHPQCQNGMLETKRCDVLIVGAGPAGLVAAAWMARLGIKTYLIDLKAGHTGPGFADGVESRTFEILDSFGIGQKIWLEANRTIDVCLWQPDELGISRECVLPNDPSNCSYFQEATLGQGRIEEHLLSFLSNHECIEVLWNTTAKDLFFDKDSASNIDKHCIKVVVETKTNKTKTVNSTIEAKYLIGSDGAHSWVRRQLGLKLHGSSGNESWGVVDCIPITRFPDIRKRCIIRSIAGNMMVIPRERGLVRFYIQLDNEISQQFKTSHDTTTLIELVRRILQPYEFHTKHIEWSTIYSIGHRVCDTFSTENRIFLAGDAVHTHTPKAGKGMNVSMQDAYNIAWKLGSVIHKTMPPDVLNTYQSERLVVAKKLVAFDKELYGQMSTSNDESGLVPDWKDLKTLLKDENSGESGAFVVYNSNHLIADMPNLSLRLTLKDHQTQKNVSKQFVIGGRVPSMILTRQSDAHPVDIQTLLDATGQWSLLVFSGSISQNRSWNKLQKMVSILDDIKLSELFTGHSKMIEGSPLLRPYLIHSSHRLDIEFEEFPQIFAPFSEEFGVSYDGIYSTQLTNTQEELYIHDESKYCRDDGQWLILVRPDQHISFIGGFDNVFRLKEFTDSVFLPTQR